MLISYDNNVIKSQKSISLGSPFKRPNLDPPNQPIINQTSTRVPVRTLPDLQQSRVCMTECRVWPFETVLFKIDFNRQNSGSFREPRILPVSDAQHQCCRSEIRCLVDPWIRDRFFSDPGSPAHIFESLVTIFGVKTKKYYNSLPIISNFVWTCSKIK